VVPGSGDEVQALKAGIMEIADIFVVNKADREGADRMAASIETMLSLEEWPAGGWRPPVLRTVATTGAGVAELVTTIDRFREQTAGTLGSRRRARAEWRLREILGRRFMQHVEAHVLEPGEFERILDRIAARESDPYGAAAAVMARAGMTGAATPRPMSLDHVGIAVPDGAPYAALLAALFGLVAGEPETLGPHRLRFIDTGDAVLELVEPLADDAPVAKFLAKRGTALHHICLRVPDVERAIAALAARGVRMIDTVPRPGAHGSRIAFIHPSSTGGILIELKEPSRLH
jgi:LAO/AO transport system kinase